MNTVLSPRSEWAQKWEHDNSLVNLGFRSTTDTISLPVIPTYMIKYSTCFVSSTNNLSLLPAYLHRVLPKQMNLSTAHNLFPLWLINHCVWSLPGADWNITLVFFERMVRLKLSEPSENLSMLLCTWIRSWQWTLSRQQTSISRTTTSFTYNLDRDCYVWHFFVSSFTSKDASAHAKQLFN